jgi:hypothetical protein
LLFFFFFFIQINLLIKLLFFAFFGWSLRRKNIFFFFLNIYLNILKIFLVSAEFFSFKNQGKPHSKIIYLVIFKNSFHFLFEKNVLRY